MSWLRRQVTAPPSWLTLVDFFTSPGMSSERIRIFLARGLTEVPASQRNFAPRHEEATMEVAWMPLETALGGIFAGHLHNPTAVVGILAAYAARSDGFARCAPRTPRRADRHELRKV